MSGCEYTRKDPVTHILSTGLKDFHYSAWSINENFSVVVIQLFTFMVSMCKHTQTLDVDMVSPWAATLEIRSAILRCEAAELHPSSQLISLWHPVGFEICPNIPYLVGILTEI